MNRQEKIDRMVEEVELTMARLKKEVEVCFKDDPEMIGFKVPTNGEHGGPLVEIRATYEDGSEFNIPLCKVGGKYV